MSEADLTRLRTAALAGEPGAMDDLLRAVQPVTVRRCRRILPYAADAEEATQDALLTVARRLPDYTGRGSFEGWVSVIATNSARATYRALRRRWSESSAAEPPEVADPRTTSVIAGTRLDLLDAIDALEDHRRTLLAPLVLRDLAGLTYADIAEQLDLPLGTVKAQVHDARIFVRARLSG